MRIAFCFVLVTLLHESSQQMGECQNCLRCNDGRCTLCSPGFYGLDCGILCPENCHLLCRSGLCHKGCNRGWYGPRCESPCPVDCDVCEQSNGLCPSTITPPVCPEGCYCIFGYCSQCKPGYVAVDDHCRVEESSGGKSNSSYDTLKAVLIGIGLLLGVIAMLSCVAFIFCRKYRKCRLSAASNCDQRRRDLSSSSGENVTSVEVHEMDGNSVHRGELSLPPYYVSYPPPSYDSLFFTVTDNSSKPPPYESTDQL